MSEPLKSGIDRLLARPGARRVSISVGVDGQILAQLWVGWPNDDTAQRIGGIAFGKTMEAAVEALLAKPTYTRSRKLPVSNGGTIEEQVE